MEPLKVGVIGRTGSGGYGHQLDRGFVGDDRCRIVAVADSDVVGLQKARERLGAERAYTDYQRMLEENDFDLMVVAPRWPDCHVDMVLRSVESGAHVYCEKPLTQTLEEADLLVAEAKKRGVLLGNALPACHEPRFGTLLDLIEDGTIGEVQHLRGLCKWDHRSGGEDFLILGLHFADMMRRIAGPPVRCAGYVGARDTGGCYKGLRQGGERIGLVSGDRMWGSYWFEGGLLGTIESWDCGIEDRAEQPYRLEVHGSKGILVHRAPYADHSLWLYEGPVVMPGEDRWRRIETEPVAEYGDYHRMAAADFIEAILVGREPACSGADSRAALEMIHAVYWSDLTGENVTFPLERRTHPLAGLWTDQDRRLGTAGREGVAVRSVREQLGAGRAGSWDLEEKR